MRIVVNKCYGGFHLPEEFCTAYGFDRYDEIDRTDTNLANFVQANGGMVRDSLACLQITEIPDEVSDWEISEYDGYESVIYVLDGKIHHA